MWRMRAAWRLGMEHFVFNFSDDFRQKVIGRFAEAYLNGRTPNPCIDCNRFMKFDRLFDRADVLGCTHIATGHYARVTMENGKYVLKKALDETKDQSYVLYAMTQAQLARTLFPLGGLRKSETRALAEAGGFVNARKPDSQDICFAPDGDYAAAVERYAGHPAEPGDFVDGSGCPLGKHRGVIRYTVGQHRGLGVPLPGKRYVVRVCAADNTVTLGEEADLYSAGALVGEVSWIAGEPPAGPVRCAAKVRYRQREQSAWAEPLPGGKLRLRFDEPQRAVTPGQAAVLYDGDTVLGGGEILAAE